MKKLNSKLVVALASAMFLFIMAVVISAIINDPLNDNYKDRIEYPLAQLGEELDGEYLFVCTVYDEYGEHISIITDYSVLRENKDTAFFSNNGTIYGVTADGYTNLYINGELLDTAIFDPNFTYEIEWGTLSDHFIIIDNDILQTMLEQR